VLPKINAKLGGLVSIPVCSTTDTITD